eukprot:scpid85151/ scgid16867/ 
MDDFLYRDAFESVENLGTPFMSAANGSSSLNFAFLPDTERQPLGNIVNSGMPESRLSRDDMLVAPSALHTMSEDTLGDLFGSNAARDPFSEQSVGRSRESVAEALLSSGLGCRQSDSSMGSPSPVSLSTLLGSNTDFSDIGPMIPQLPSVTSSPTPTSFFTPTAQCTVTAPTSLAISSPLSGPGAGMVARSPRSKQPRSHKLKSPSTGPKPAEEFKLSAEYRDKRSRNNEAVRKSRIKSKQKSRETEEEVQDLRQENAELKRSLDSLRSHLETLQTLRPNLLSELDEEIGG